MIFLLFELSPNHVSEDFEFLMGVKAKAIMCLDAVLVNNSQTSEGFETIREVLSAPNPVQYTNPTRSIGTHGGTANVYIASSQSVGFPPPRLVFSRSSILVMLDD